MVDIDFTYDSLKALCDWCELTVALNDSLTKAELDHLLNNKGYSAEDSENYINSVWRELKSRNKRYNSISPMSIDSVSVDTNIDWKQYPEYVLMLVLSLEGNGWRTQTTAVLFERLCSEALEEYIGGQAKVVGFPNTVSVAEICLIIGEEFTQELPPRYKDRKLDVVGWKSIDDRNNKLLILMQCAAGNDWRAKTTELQVEVWRDYIRFGCTPTRAFGFAHIVNDDLFFDTGKEGGLIFDRLRLYRYLHGKSAFTDNNLRDEVLKWCCDRLALTA